MMRSICPWTAVSDNPIQKVGIRTGVDSWHTAEGTKYWGYQWNITTVGNVVYTIYARCFDGGEYALEAADGDGSECSRDVW